MPKVCGIYKITNPNGAIYIGQSQDCYARKSVYKGQHCKFQIKLYRSILKYGWDSHTFEIIAECEKSELNELEIYYIGHYDCFETEHGLNLRSGGNRPVWSKESRQKVSETIKGKKSPFKGIPRTEDVKTKIGNANRGRKLPPVTQEYRDKMSEIKKGNQIMVGRKHSEETKLKMSESQKKLNRIGHWYGKKMSDETKEKMRLSRIDYLKRKQ